jgi:RNase H-like domain found in reverse transcriptase
MSELILVQPNPERCYQLETDASGYATGGTLSQEGEDGKWHYAIELIEGAEPFLTKVYPMSVNEQKELDKFLDENLTSGHIRHFVYEWLVMDLCNRLDPNRPSKLSKAHVL